MKMKLSLTAILFMATLPALADQCDIIPVAQANAAKAIIEAQSPSRAGGRDYNDPTVVVTFCDSCTGDKQTPITVASVQVNMADQKMFPGQASVSVVDSTGKATELDLAYAFLQVGHTEAPVRLAPLVGCSYHQGTAGDILQ